ncbi:MAG: hypothetical protein FWD46_03520 [Cystobacterineae bacterium]|nr:hypothetical protein [Cystobacterineae bacterium]
MSCIAKTDAGLMERRVFIGRPNTYGCASMRFERYWSISRKPKPLIKNHRN